MAKVFNVSAVCIPRDHYMVNIDKRLAEIKKLVDDGKYFTINCARQYGKTTTLRALKEYLRNDYYAVMLDFQKIGNAKYRNENTFSLAFAKIFLRELKGNGIFADNAQCQGIHDLEINVECRSENFELLELFENLSDICAEADKPLVLMIDEVDSATNNQVFLDFLAQLRAYYIERTVRPVFQSVILAGVYDVKNLKRKIRMEDDHKINSPWNIAADFKIDMSFSEDGIAGMLREYECDYHTGMDVEEMAGLLYDYTSGYPFLVSRLCMLMDEVIVKQGEPEAKSSAWTKSGFHEAVRLLLSEKIHCLSH